MFWKGREKNYLKIWRALQICLEPPSCSEEAEIYILKEQTDWVATDVSFQITFEKAMFCSVSKLCLILCNPMDTASSPVIYCLPELAQTHAYWVINTIWPSHPLPPPSPFAFNLSQHQGHFQWPKYWSFSISPSNEYSGLISFRVLTGFTSLRSKGLKNHLQNHNLKALFSL